MRLSKIKLTGFKSFVDPTTLSFPSHRVGIVGPNGCGKSNVIDAVRWVLGESSAKHLRGAAMSDVIFNGSRSRKSVEQASIELVFADVNVPQYPQHSEIAVKRQLSRDGQSVYFLNSVRCRRKDITDLLLGTGLGPRSYAIIEQGMISRLIEAKPEELRVFLEEAASLSKYKERRKETEQRMSHTRDNLARLDEIRNELAKQLDKLKKQAKQAEKYQELKQSEQLLKAQLQALRWYTLDTSIQEQEQLIEEQAARLETSISALQNFDATHKQQRQARTMAQDTLDEVQTRFYAIDSEINRLEQAIQHANDRYEQLQWDLEQVENRQETTQRTLEADQQQVTQLKTDIQTIELETATQQQAETLAKQSLAEAEQRFQDWQTQWEAFNQQAAAPTQRAQVERTRLQNLEQRLAQNKQRLFRLEEEERHLEIETLESVLIKLDQEITALQVELEEMESTFKTHQAAVLKLRDVTQQLSGQLHTTQSEVHKLNGRLASLEALQEAALGKNNTHLSEWLAAQGLHNAPRLIEFLQVEPGWERAVETVLGERLQAFCVAETSTWQAALEQPPPGKLAVFETHAHPTTPKVLQSTSTNRNQYFTLLDKVQAPWSLTSWLAGVWIAETVNDAYHLRSQLALHESVITPQGVWLGSNWLHSQQGLDKQSGILAREQEMHDLDNQLKVLNHQVEQFTDELGQQRSNLHKQENYRDQTQQQINDIQKELSQLQSQYSNKQVRLEHIKVQLQRIAAERIELTEQISDDNQELDSTRKVLHAALEEMAQLADERETLTQQRNLLQEAVVQANQTWQRVKEAQHQQEVKLESLRTDYARLQQGIERLTVQAEQLNEQHYELQSQLDKQADPLAKWHSQLTDYQEQKTEIDEALLQAKQTIAHLEAALNDHDGERQRLELRGNELRTLLEQTRMDCQANQVRRQTLEEQLQETQWSPIALLADLPEYADEASWLAQIEAVERKLERIGSVNLTALAEYEAQSQRQQFLDQQAEDLYNTLNLLEDAIKTIDRETRTRFKYTLDQVNSHLQTMFPHLFGGGEAYLQLIGEDILKAGITIMARPPGKRNTHIQLLSGGEKALTAIALVFAIFELNPAPFCMLDEVDAPLDDTNVGRFCRLVKTMSERVQFIFISHNKITMEIADQLIGVTMQEAGVSRLVAVDIDKAMDMVKV